MRMLDTAVVTRRSEPVKARRSIFPFSPCAFSFILSYLHTSRPRRAEKRPATAA